tara:strand:- start:245 stop:364 length:120 start_codon:yes stop_codon:yes gene_type:complete
VKNIRIKDSIESFITGILDKAYYKKRHHVGAYFKYIVSD